jgi:RHS repeat-associated protein
MLGAQGIEAKIDETNQTEAYYEVDANDNRVTDPTTGNGIIAYRGVTAWYIYDGHGNVIGTVNQTGVFTANPTLDVYGIPRATGAAATKQGYCGSLGHVTDDTGLVYMKARYYDPSVGRFVSEDPKGNGTNWYVYADNNPVNKADSDGKESTFQSLLMLFFDSVFATFFVIPFCKKYGIDVLADNFFEQFCKASGQAAQRVLSIVQDFASDVGDGASAFEDVMEYVVETQLQVANIEEAVGIGVKSTVAAGEAEEEAAFMDAGAGI